MRTMSPKAIWKPAKRFPRVDWAATPATIPMIPAEASTEVPSARKLGKVTSIAATAMTATRTVTTRMIRVTWVRTRRSRAGSRVEVA